MPLTREKSELQAELDSVYLENIGEDILFLWVEKVNTLIKMFGEGKVSPQPHFPTQARDIVSISFFDTKSDVMKTFAGKRVFREAERLYRY